MEWDTFEASRQPAARGTTRGAAVERTLVKYFGDNEYHHLQRLAEQARLMRSRAPGKIPVSTQTVYRQQSWGSFLVSQLYSTRS